MKLTERKKKVLIVLGTIVGLIALFLFVVFVPIGDSENKQEIIPDDVVENELGDEKKANSPDLEDDDSEITGVEGGKNTPSKESTSKVKKESASVKNGVVIPEPDTSVKSDNVENSQDSIPGENQAGEGNEEQTDTWDEEETITDNNVTENTDVVENTDTDNSNMGDSTTNVDENAAETNVSEPTAPTPSESEEPSETGGSENTGL